MSKRKAPIFSGEESTGLWKAINDLGKKPNTDLSALLYIFGCKCQELESRVEELEAALEVKKKP